MIPIVCETGRFQDGQIMLTMSVLNFTEMPKMSNKSKKKVDCSIDMFLEERKINLPKDSRLYV